MEHAEGGSSPDVEVRKGFSEDRTQRMNPGWPTEAAEKQRVRKALLAQEMTRTTAQWAAQHCNEGEANVQYI